MSATAESSEGPLPDRAELAVVGGGVAGLAVAWRAAAAGMRVVVIDDRERRVPATSVAAGMIAPVGEASWGEERLLAAALRAAELWPRFASELESSAEVAVPYRRCGGLYVALDRDEGTELRRRHELHRRLDLDAELLLPSEARGREPGLSTGLTAAISAPREAEVDPRALLDALGAAARRCGATLAPGRAERIDAARGSIALRGGGRLVAERLVLATGAWAGADRVEGIAPLPVRPVKGEIVRLRADPAAMPCERLISGERFYLVPRADGEVVVGATVTERGFDQRVSAGGVHELLREAYRALPEIAELDFTEAVAGLRPGTPDNAPIVGWVPLADGGPSRLLAACGLYRNGILLAPLLAEAGAALLAGEEAPAELGALGPERFGAGLERGAHELAEARR